MAKIALSEVPLSGTRVVEIEGKKVLLCRSSAGIHALAANCPHQALTLDGGRVRGSSIICPHHGARFSLEDGRSMSPLTNNPLTLFPVTIAGEEMDVAL